MSYGERKKAREAALFAFERCYREVTEFSGGLSIARVTQSDGAIIGAIIYVAGITAPQTVQAVEAIQVAFEKETANGKRSDGAN